jgi:hypothetical protein
LQSLSIIIFALKKENFFMLKQTLTQEQLDEIYKELPHDFIVILNGRRILGKRIDQADVFILLN